MTECTQRTLEFHQLGRREITARFDAPAITSDAGGLLLREIDEKFGFLEQFAEFVSVAYSPDGKLVASGSGDRRIGLWNAETGEHIRWLSGHISTVWSVAFSADSSTLASGGVDTLVRLWDIDTGEQTTTLRGHTRTVSAAAFSPVGTVLATASEDSTVRLWQGEFNKHQTTTPGVE